MHVVKLAEERMPEGVREAFDRLQARRWEVARRGAKERLARAYFTDPGKSPVANGGDDSDFSHAFEYETYSAGTGAD